MTSSKILNAVIPLVADLAQELSERERLRRLLAALRTLLPADAVALLRLEGEWLRPVAMDGLVPDALGRRFKVAEHPRLAQLLAAGQAMRAQFTRGRVVGLFPEGTTSPGFDVLPFYANLFEPARQGAAAIQPVALRYFHGEGRSDFAAYVGEETLVQNLWRVLGGSGVRIEIAFLPPVWSGEGEAPARAALGRQSHEAIRQALN